MVSKGEDQTQERGEERGGEREREERPFVLKWTELNNDSIKHQRRDQDMEPGFRSLENTCFHTHFLKQLLKMWRNL